jgi:hypothetical protein
LERTPQGHFDFKVSPKGLIGAPPSVMSFVIDENMLTARHSFDGFCRRYWRQSGHDFLQRTRPLMTQSGHRWSLNEPRLNRYDALS